VSFLADRIEQRPGGDMAALGAGEALYRHWLLGLDLEYGRKQADAIRQVLALLAGAEEAHGWVFGAGRKGDPAGGGVLTRYRARIATRALDAIVALGLGDRLSTTAGRTGAGWGCPGRARSK
jgi:hypothetical protein